MSFPSLPVSRPACLLCSLAACFAMPALAQSVYEEEELVPVVVTASRIAQSQKEALPATTVITQERIRNRQAMDLPDLLQSEAGINLAQTGGVGQATSVFMRGANANQVLILLDGVPLRDTTSTGSPVELQHILPEQIERIEVVRGNVSAIYGSGAIGGVIQIFTKQGEDKPSVSLTAEAGTDNTTRLSVGFSGRQEEIKYRLGVTRLKTDGYSVMNRRQYPNENLDDDGTRDVSINAAISRQWGVGNEFGARLYAYDAKYEYDGGGSGTPDQNNYGKSREWTAAVFSKNRLTDDWDSTVTLSQTEMERTAYSRGGTYPDNTSQFKSNTSLAQWHNQLALSSDWMATAGMDVAREKANIGVPAQISRTNHSLYTGVNGKMGDHSLQLNARYDHVQASGSDTTGYLGYGYDLTTSFKLIASASTAFLAPTLYQVYDPYSGNRSLKAERSRSYEAGLQYAHNSTLLRATFFDTHTRDMINWVSTGGWSGQYFNVGRAKNKGFELNGQTRQVGLDIRGNLTLQDPIDRDTGKQLLRRAKKTASLDVSKTLGAWSIGGDVHYEAHRPDKPSQNVSKQLPSYAVFNMHARYRISKEVSVFARIKNLLDRDYQTAYGYDMPDRGFFAGIDWKM